MSRSLRNLDFRRSFGLLLPLRLNATAARMRSFKAASSTLSPSWMSMARLTFPSRLELNRPEGSFNAAPLANVILTTFLYVSPVQTMPPWEKTGVPGDVALTHFRSSTISGSASCMISRTFASIFPRSEEHTSELQSPDQLVCRLLLEKKNPRPIGVEDGGNRRVHPLLPVVGHRKRLGVALGLVIDPARGDRVGVAAVGLWFRVNLRVV